MNIEDIGREVLDIEAKALNQAKNCINEDFVQAVTVMQGTSGRIVVTGMGKSGIIGKKISATLTSTGTPSVFLHPSEALHGDIGIIKGDDLVLALSSSGETLEVIRLLTYIKRIGVKVISVTGDSHSSLARGSDISINFDIEKEACSTGLVPSTSTTLTLAIGDALCIALMKMKGFNREDFRFNHPGGSIGKKLLKVKHLMHTNSEIPIVNKNMVLTEVIETIDKKKFGVAIVTDRDLSVLGIITDGDLRRLFLKRIDFSTSTAENCMTTSPFSIQEDNLAVEALKILESNRITSLVVTRDNKLKGLIHLHDLWRTEMI